MKAIDYFARLDYALYRFFAKWGEVIISYPNRFFYAVLILASVMFPLFAGFLTLSLLCYAYRRKEVGRVL
jgi:hypothetical protein